MTPSQHAEKLTKAIMPLLAGHPSEIQGAVLADLLAMWLAGHVGPNQDFVRENLLQIHIEMVRELIPINSASRAK